MKDKLELLSAVILYAVTKICLA